jgi:LysR family glycine cleavage system transcriptional activator
LRLNASNDPVDLTREAVDIDLRYGARRLQPAGTMVLDLPTETIVPLCSPTLLEGEHPIRTVADLRHHTLIHSEGCLVGWRDFMRLHRKTPIDISRGPRFDRSFMAISAATDGGGVCLESLLLVQRELETGRLVAPFGFDGLKVNGYTLNLLKSCADLPKVRSFQDWLFEELDRS